ncbi:hypothetical protein PVAP13_8KG171800 [Panicum virgatum]|uniref:Uncharacterized protein n=1 Tax=Panicum virgatum TaxID=38727 RepID=A0A8T0PRS4_PANVG|nr:hypothetical protein PVAP13_8KG171800 [Panicum virgatum]
MISILVHGALHPAGVGRTWAAEGASFGVGSPSHQCRLDLGPLRAPRSLGAARSQGAAVGSKPSAC